MKTREAKKRLEEIVKNDYVIKHDRFSAKFSVWKLAILTVEILIGILQELFDIKQGLKNERTQKDTAEDA